MPRMIDLTGQRFGRWVVVERGSTKTFPSGDRRIRWLCACDCGSEKEVDGISLRNGVSLSCGCYEKELKTIHGGVGTSTYRSWQAMKARCLNPNYEEYPNYGGKGVTICERWLNSFQNFLDDMGVRPEGMTLDRWPKCEGNYEPGNCRWATPKQQAENRGDNILLFYGDELVSVEEAALRAGVNRDTIMRRLRRGVQGEALFAPPDPARQATGRAGVEKRWGSR
jgi:hypothetical protein